MKAVVYTARHLGLVSLGLTVLAVTACGVSDADHRRVVTERDSLVTSLAAARAELEETKFGAPRLLTQAKAALAAGKFREALDASTQLLDRHPEAAERVEAATIKTFASQRVAQVAADVQRAKDEAAKAEQRRLAQALGGVYSRVDNVRDVTFYYAKGQSHFVNDRTHPLLYIVKPKQGPPSLRFIIRYVSDDWLFIESYTIKTDGETHTIAPSYGEIERDNGMGGIWEWYNTDAGATELRIARAIIGSKSAIIRFSGKQYYKDRTVSAADKRAMQVVLDAYDVLQKQSG
jgi:hypothetical protein